MKKREAMRLVKALRSGKYEQGRNYLTRDDRYCCLGVACAISKGVNSVKNREIVEYDGFAGVLSPRMQDKFGFASCEGARRDLEHLEIGGKKFASLAKANDAGVPFSDIADYIEANYLYL